MVRPVVSPVLLLLPFVLLLVNHAQAQDHDATSPGTLRPEWTDPEPFRKTTKTGHVFVRDESNPKLGEAWRGPDGLVWGDLVQNGDGSPKFMTHNEATAYCKGIGGWLPSREDFIRLREYLGAAPGTEDGYTPQILPNLTYTIQGQTSSRYFWTSTPRPGYSNHAWAFRAIHGSFISFSRHRSDFRSVRCVSTPL